MEYSNIYKLTLQPFWKVNKSTLTISLRLPLMPSVSSTNWLPVVDSSKVMSNISSKLWSRLIFFTSTHYFIASKTVQWWSSSEETRKKERLSKIIRGKTYNIYRNTINKGTGSETMWNLWRTRRSKSTLTCCISFKKSINTTANYQKIRNKRLIKSIFSSQFNKKVKYHSKLSFRNLKDSKTQWVRKGRSRLNVP